MSRTIGKIFLLIFGVLCSAAKRPPFEVRSVDDFEFHTAAVNYRLPNNTRPLEYDISLSIRIDQNNESFTGTVEIQILVEELTNYITLHQRALRYHSVRLRQGHSDVPILPFTYDAVTDFLTIRTKGVELKQGAIYTLEIVYSGILSRDKKGFYRSSYLAEGDLT